jgi:hypothetical protein
MTGTEMNANLGLRLEDPAQSVFTESAKVDAINLSQKTVVNMIDNGYLTELEQIVNDQALVSGSVSFTSAGIDPIRGGITGIYDETNNVWCTMIEAKDLKRLENSYLSGTTSNPVAYVFNETIYVKPTSVSLIDIWYLASPTDYVVGALSAECALNPALHELVLDFAEAQLWRMDAKADRATSAYNNALNLVKVLNERYQVEKPEGIGTKGR